MPFLNWVFNLRLNDGQKCDEKQGICLIPKYALFNDTRKDSNFTVEEPECHPLHQVMKGASPERAHTSIISLLIRCPEEDSSIYVRSLAKMHSLNLIMRILSTAPVEGRSMQQHISAPHKSRSPNMKHCQRQAGLRKHDN